MDKKARRATQAARKPTMESNRCWRGQPCHQKIQQLEITRKDKVTNFWLEHLVGIHRHVKSLHKHQWEPRRNTWMAYRRSHVLTTKNNRLQTQKTTGLLLVSQQCARSSLPLWFIIAERTNTFITQHQLLPTEQKGCKKRSYECQDQPLINKRILEECKTRKKNVSTSCIDYKKVFDSVPHKWITKCLQIYKVCPVIVNFIKENMRTWKTTLQLNYVKGTATSRPVKITF